MTVTATQGGSPANGMGLRVMVITGAKPVSSQAGGSAGTNFASGTSYTVSVTTTQANSRVYGAGTAFTGSVSSSAAANTTLIDNSLDATNSDDYVTFKATSLTGTPGATSFGFTNTANAGSCGPAAYEVLVATTLAEDASGPAFATTTSATAVTTASFTPPAGSLLVALVAANGSTGSETMALSDTGGGLNWTEKARNTSGAGNDYSGVWIADVPAGGVTWAPQRYGQAAPDSRAPFQQRDRRDANTTGSAANPLPSPLDTAWQADAAYWHLYGDAHLRDRRAYYYQRALVSDPSLLAPAGNLDPTTDGQDDLGRRWRAPATHYDRRLVPQQRQYCDVTLLGTAQLENELLGGADTLRHSLTSAYLDRRQVPQQRAYVSDPSSYPADSAVGAGVVLQWTGPEDLSAWIAQRRLISDPSAYPPQNNLDPLLMGEGYLELHQHQAATHYDRREVPQQRAYISDPSFYPTVAPADPLTVAWGAGGPYWHLYNRAADATDRRMVPQQRAYASDPLLLTPYLLENELLGGADTARHYLTAAWYDRREVPSQPPRLADPLLIATAQLENELLGSADDLARHRAWYADRREYPAQRAGITLPDVPADPLFLGDDRARHALIAGYWPRGWSWFQRQLFPLPAPPPPFTAGTLTAADAPSGALTGATAPSGILTAATQTTGGPS